MTRENFNINNLHVAAPCPVGWETMSGDECVRHCNLCKLNVYNISEMTAEEARALFAKSEGRICGRLYKRADGTVLTKDCPVGFRAYRKRAARRAGAALAAILGLFSVSFGQQRKEDGEKSIDASKAKIVRTIKQKNVLTGTITDRHGNPVVDVEVVIFPSGGADGEKLQVRSDGKGFYQSPVLAEGVYTLEVGSEVKYYRVTGIKINNDEQVTLDIRLDIEFGYFTSGYVVQGLPPLRTDFRQLLKLKPDAAPEEETEKPPR